MKLLAIIFGAALLAATATAQPVFVSVCNFAITNGASPLGRLALGPDGNLYGTTQQGGVNGGGTVYRLTANGTLTALASFGTTLGTSPDAGLTLGSDGNFYGTANSGGSAGDGTFFQFKTNGTLTQLASFTGGNGKSPQADLCLGRDGKFYSLTSAGTGTNNFGTLFRIDTNGNLATLTSFTNGNGAYPNSSLTLGTDGAFYGVTPYGGRTNLNSGSGYGTVFKVTTNGVLTPLFAFSNTNGYYPDGGLALGSDG